MQIQTARLILRDYLPADWSELHEFSKDPEFSQYDAWGPNSEQDTKDFVARMIAEANLNPRYRFGFAVVNRTSGKAIGTVGIRRECESSVVGSIGYSIHPHFQKQGLATEAAQALLEFGFKNLKLQVIWAGSDVLNPASYRVMEKCGMQRVGHLVRHKEFKGEWHDSFRYEITLPSYLRSRDETPRNKN